MTQEFSLFDSILDKTQPILIIKDLDLKFYHPNTLSKKANQESRINEKEEKRLRSLLKIKTKRQEVLEEQLDKVEDEEKLNPLLQEIGAVDDEVYELTQQINSQVFNYVALTSRSTKETIVNQVEQKLKQSKLEYDIVQIGNDIYFRILAAVKEFNEREKKAISQMLGTEE